MGNLRWLLGVVLTFLVSPLILKFQCRECYMRDDIDVHIINVYMLST